MAEGAPTQSVDDVATHASQQNTMLADRAAASPTGSTAAAAKPDSTTRTAASVEHADVREQLNALEAAASIRLGSRGLPVNGRLPS